jgi:glycerol kinase
MAVILALDQGTTSSRAILFDEDGTILAIAQREFRQIYPQPGWVEHNPANIWESQSASARLAIESSGISPNDLTALGISNQRETTLIWDRNTGDPIYNAIVWQDRRTAEICERMKADGLEPLFHQRTGLVLDPYFSASKIRWLLDNVSGARKRVERGELAFGTIDTFLLWKLTGGNVHATDVSNASRTLLFNLHSLEWDEELLQLFDIPRSILPTVQASSVHFGDADSGILGASIPIAGIAGDQQAATFGQTCFETGMVKNTYGTGSFLLMNTGSEPRPSKNRLLTTVGWKLNDKTTYALEGSVFVTGAAVQWLRDELGVINSASDSEALAETVTATEGVYFVPAFAGLGAPFWDSAARAAIVGLSRGTGKAHIARAVLEAACYQSRDVIEAMQADCGASLVDLRVDGGMTSNNLLLQMQADLLGIPVHRPAITETSALGAAYLAGLAAGVWRDTKQVAGQWRIDRTFEPRISADQREAMYDGWKRAVKRVRSPVDR